MRRMLWLGVGLAVGALGVRMVARKAQALTPAGLASSARTSTTELLDSVRSFVADVRDGMAEREAEIQSAFIDGIRVDGDWVEGDLGTTIIEEGTR